jgi:hypothetical protein
MTFSIGDLVVQNGDNEVMRVLEYSKGISSASDDNPDTVHVAIGNDDSDDWFRADELTLVTAVENIIIQEVKPMEPNTPRGTQEEIHESICQMFIQTAQYMEANLDGETVHLSIIAEYRNGNNLDVEFTASIGYGSENKVISSNLFKSAQVSVARFTENQGLKPLSIPMFKEAAE